jgi:transposase
LLMPSYNAENERIKRRYFAYLKEAKRRGEPSLDAAAKALHRFETYTRFRSFKAACSSAHHWARELVQLGHTVRLIPPQYVKPYVKRNKTDAADAEAICEAVGRPNMRFVPIPWRNMPSVAGCRKRLCDVVTKAVTGLRTGSQHQSRSRRSKSYCHAIPAQLGACRDERC